MRRIDLARSGRLDELYESRAPDDSADFEIYKWLCAAEDFGHDASEHISDHLETSSLRYDDDGYEQAAAHWELACAYLEGVEGLPKSLELAEKHLELALADFAVPVIAAGCGRPYDSDSIAERLDPDAYEVLETALRGDPYRAVVRRVERLRRLRAIGSVPKIVLQNEARLLMEAARTLAAEDLRDEEP